MFKHLFFYREKNGNGILSKSIFYVLFLENVNFQVFRYFTKYIIPKLRLLFCIMSIACLQDEAAEGKCWCFGPVRILLDKGKVKVKSQNVNKFKKYIWAVRQTFYEIVSDVESHITVKGHLTTITVILSFDLIQSDIVQNEGQRSGHQGQI